MADTEMAETVVFVTGTGTEVGKTWAAAALARALRRAGRPVRACKPVQSYDPADESPTDAEILAEATGQHPDEVCPRRRTYPVPLAPPMAAAKLGLICPTLDEIAEHCRSVGSERAGPATGAAGCAGVVIVEGAGGLFSPVAPDGHNLDLIERIDPRHVIVVASAVLGAIHDTLACHIPLAGRSPAVLLNRFDPQAEVQRLNLDWLRAQGLTVVTSPEAAAEAI